jgi:hypothetical protein
MPLIYAGPQYGLGSLIFPTSKENYESLRFRIVIFSLLRRMEIQHKKGKKSSRKPKGKKA